MQRTEDHLPNKLTFVHIGDRHHRCLSPMCKCVYLILFIGGGIVTLCKIMVFGSNLMEGRMIYLIAFLAACYAEVYVVIALGAVLGAPKMMVIFAATAILGIILGKLEMSALINAIKREFEADSEMTDTVIELLYVLLGMILMVIPGFLTDVAGFLMIIPPSRRYFTSRAGLNFRDKIKNVTEQKRREFREKKKK